MKYKLPCIKPCLHAVVACNRSLVLGNFINITDIYIHQCNLKLSEQFDEKWTLKIKDETKDIKLYKEKFYHYDLDSSYKMSSIGVTNHQTLLNFTFKTVIFI